MFYLFEIFKKRAFRGCMGGWGGGGIIFLRNSEQKLGGSNSLGSLPVQSARVAG